MITSIEKLPLESTPYTCVYKTTFYLSQELVAEIRSGTMPAEVVGQLLCDEIKTTLGTTG